MLMISNGMMVGVMLMTKINEALVDQIAQLEVDALLEGLNDPELRKNPAFLDKVRKFLKENDLKTTPETPGVQQLMKRQTTTEIPIFDEVKRLNNATVVRRAD
nr:hypothetical protein JOCKYQNQ_JOCKYQNQ_CDS_0007 [Autographiviridae sp.]